MNKWIYYSLLPLVNQDVEILEDFTHINQKIQCKCKICQEIFFSTPQKILYGYLHTNPSYNNCRFSLNNKMCYSSEQCAELQNQMQLFWNKYHDKYIFVSHYSLGLPVVIEHKKTKKQLKIDLYDLNFQESKCNSDTKKIVKTSDSNKTNKTYNFYKKKSDYVFTGTVQEFLKDIGKNLSYKYIEQLKRYRWFNENYTTRKPRQHNNETHYHVQSEVEGENNLYTRIRRKCKRRHMCERRGDYKCKLCKIKTEPFYSKQEFYEQVKKNNPNIDVLDEYISYNKEMTCRCKTCGCEFKKMPCKLFNGIKCPQCISSKGEQFLQSYLEQLGIMYEREKQFPDLKYIKHLRFDFYLVDYNAVIEYDGRQHFEPVYFHTKTYSEAKADFKSLQQRDKIKNNYCVEHNIPILRIKYTNKNMTETVNKFISNLTKNNE